MHVLYTSDNLSLPDTDYVNEVRVFFFILKYNFWIVNTNTSKFWPIRVILMEMR